MKKAGAYLQTGALVVVAHPDDEILWLAPALSGAATVLCALPVHGQDPAVTQGRETVRDNYPLRSFQWLPLQSAGVHRRSDWERRRPTQYGVTLATSCPPQRAHLYQDNFATMLELLAPYLRQYRVVYTHNPWGEYGHEEHVQVSNAVLTLAEQHGCSVWAWDGFPRRRLLKEGARLRADFYRRRVAQLPKCQLQVDMAFYRQVKQLYLANGAWTWDECYEPPEVSTYLQLVDEGRVLLRPLHKPPGFLPFRIAARRAQRSARVRLGQARRASLSWLRPGPLN